MDYSDLDTFLSISSYSNEPKDNKDNNFGNRMWLLFRSILCIFSISVWDIAHFFNTIHNILICSLFGIFLLISIAFQYHRLLRKTMNAELSESCKIKLINVVGITIVSATVVVGTLMWEYESAANQWFMPLCVMVRTIATVIIFECECEVIRREEFAKKIIQV